MGSYYQVPTVLSSENNIDIFSNKYVTCQLILLLRAFHRYLFPKVTSLNTEGLSHFRVGNYFLLSL
jgi:hypothetical protein